MATPQTHPDPAATVILLRARSDPFEVLMVHRHSRGFFGSLMVFPGGAVDDSDRSELARSVVSGPDEDHDHRAAALRELAEETGIAYGSDGCHRAPPLKGDDLYRWHLERGEVLPGEDLTLVSRWVTPEMAPRRFDTRFYLLSAVEPPAVRLDTDELIDYRWMTPQEALDRHESGDYPMVLPTLAHLRWLARRPTIEDALGSADGADGRSLVHPQRAHDGSLIPTLLPSESP